MDIKNLIKGSSAALVLAIAFFGGMGLGDQQLASTGAGYRSSTVQPYQIINNDLTIARGTGYNSGKFNVDSSGNVNASGTIRAVSFTGDGSALTGISSVSSTNYSVFNNLWVGGSTTSTITGNTLSSGITTGYNLGKFYVDSSGNVSASGTANVAGNGTSTFAYGATFATTGGNVGIGTTEAVTPLHVKGGPTGTQSWNKTATINATFPSFIFNSNETKWGGMAYDYTSAMRFWINAGSDDIFATNAVMSILNNGNVGIGNLMPTTKLTVSGGDLTIGSNGATTTITGNTIASGVITGYNLGKFYVDSSGNMNASGTLNGIAINSFEKAFTYTTSTAWSVSTTPALGVAIQAQTWTQASCFTDVGTVYIQFGNGTATTTAFQITTVPSTVTFGTALSFTADSRRYAEFGNSASSPKSVSCSVKGSY